MATASRAFLASQLAGRPAAAAWLLLLAAHSLPLLYHGVELAAPAVRALLQRAYRLRTPLGYTGVKALWYGPGTAHTHNRARTQPCLLRFLLAPASFFLTLLFCAGAASYGLALALPRRVPDGSAGPAPCICSPSAASPSSLCGSLLSSARSL